MPPVVRAHALITLGKCHPALKMGLGVAQPFWGSSAQNPGEKEAWGALVRGEEPGHKGQEKRKEPPAVPGEVQVAHEKNFLHGKSC